MYLPDQRNRFVLLGHGEPAVSVVIQGHLGNRTTFCDVGENVCAFSLLTTSFEPLPDSAGIPARNAALNGRKNLTVLRLRVVGLEIRGRFL